MKEGTKGKGDLGESRGASGPKRNPQGRLGCREGGSQADQRGRDRQRVGETRQARDGGRRGVSSEDLGERRGVVVRKDRKGLVAASLTQCVLRWLTQNTTSSQCADPPLHCTRHDCSVALQPCNCMHSPLQRRSLRTAGSCSIANFPACPFRVSSDSS